MAVTESNHFVAFEVFVPAESEVIAAFLCCGRRLIAVDDADIEIFLLVKEHHGLCKNGIKAPLSFITPKGGIDPGVVDFRLPIFVLLNR
ncbi:MAG: hypothetical protein KME18_24635 [Phormidium tanganyikae FI6-MK23]|nr:hypothetical protein [Phormidium tanganyikae FI6-MK23]